MKKKAKQDAAAEQNKPKTGPTTRRAKTGAATPKSAPPSPPSAVKRTPANRATTSKKTTTLVANVDVGYGQDLYLRGDAPGLSWDTGTLMTCTNHDLWEWRSNEVKSSFHCKALINDEQWSQGDDFVVQPGERKTIRPQF